MPTALRPYWLLASSAFRSRLMYVGSMWASMAANIVFGFIRASILTSAAASQGGELAGYTTSQLNAYVWWSQALLGTIRLWGVTQLGRDIKSGQVAVQLLRPLSLIGSGVANELGLATFSLLPRVLPVLLIGALTFGFAAPPSLAALGLGLLSVLLATVLAYLCNHCLSCLAFWVLEIRGYRLAYQTIGMFLAGLYVPITMFPGWLRHVAAALPFSSMLQTPVDVLAGRHGPTDSLVQVGIQVAWVVAMWGLASILTARGRRTLEVQGG